MCGGVSDHECDVAPRSTTSPAVSSTRTRSPARSPTTGRMDQGGQRGGFATASYEAGLVSGVLLDIGAGFGALTFELIDRGSTRAIAVDASSSYLDAGAREATRRRKTGSIEFVHGDFVDVAATLPNADVVTLDRVVCCYPHVEPLLAARWSTRRARWRSRTRAGPGTRAPRWAPTISSAGSQAIRFAPSCTHPHSWSA